MRWRKDSAGRKTVARTEPGASSVIWTGGFFLLKMDVQKVA